MTMLTRLAIPLSLLAACVTTPRVQVTRQGVWLQPLPPNCPIKIANIDSQQAMRDYQTAGMVLLRTERDAVNLSPAEHAELAKAVCKLGSETIVPMTQIRGYITFLALGKRRAQPLGMASAPAKAAPKAPQGLVVAVFDLEDKENILAAGEREKLADYLATKLAEQRGYRVIPREQLRKRLVGERKKSYRACYDSSCQIELGKSLAAQSVVSLRLIKLGERCTLTAKLFELKSETTQAAASSKGACTVSDLQSAVERVASRLSNE